MCVIICSATNKRHEGSAIQHMVQEAMTDREKKLYEATAKLTDEQLDMVIELIIKEVSKKAASPTEKPKESK